MTEESMAGVLLRNGEPVEAVIFYGDGPYWFSGGAKDEAFVPEEMRNRSLTWEEALPLLTNQSAYGDYGSLSIWEFYAWTPTQILMVNEYNGSHAPMWVPRNPTAFKPEA